MTDILLASTSVDELIRHDIGTEVIGSLHNLQLQLAGISSDIFVQAPTEVEVISISSLFASMISV